MTRPPQQTTLSQLILLIKLASPIILGNFAYALLNLTDILMAGMAGTPDQAGVAIGGSFFFPAITFVIGMVSALHPVIARYCGANTREKIPQAHAHATVACMIIAMILMAILLALAAFAINIDADARMEEVARYYVVCVAFTIPIAALYSNGRAYCEALGQTRTTLYFGLLSVVLNVPLNYILIFGKFSLPALGGIGCGVATLISMAISTVILFIYISLHPKLKHHSWLKNKDGINKEGVISYFKLSLPLGISSAVECSCFTFIALLLSPLGPTAVSAHTITMSLTSMVFNIPLSFGIATAITVGYAIGQNNLHALRNNIKAAYWAMLICLTVNISILVLGHDLLPSFFSTDPKVLAVSSFLMYFAAANQSFESLQTIQAFILRGFKDTKTILLVTFIAFYCVALPIGISLCYGYLHLPPMPLFTGLSESINIAWLKGLLFMLGTEGFSLMGPQGFWLGLFSGLLSASILYRFRVLKHYRALKQQLNSRVTPSLSASTNASSSDNATAVDGNTTVTDASTTTADSSTAPDVDKHNVANHTLANASR